MSGSRKRIGIYGVSDEVLRLGQLLAANPAVQVVRFWHPDRDDALARARNLGPEVAAELAPLLTDDLEAFVLHSDLSAIIDGGEPGGPDAFGGLDGGEMLAARFPDVMESSIQLLSPLTARLLWGYGVAARDRKAELLQALAEIVESVDLTVDSDEKVSAEKFE